MRLTRKGITVKNEYFRGLQHAADQGTKWKCFLSASTQIAGIHGQCVLMMFLVLMNHNSLSVFLQGFPVSSLSAVTVLTKRQVC